MPDGYLPYFVIGAILFTAGALSAIGAWAGWLHRHDVVLAVDDPTDEPDVDMMSVAEHLDVEPTATYQPCGHTWHAQAGCDCGGEHRCTRLPGGHQRHVCQCGAQEDPEQVVLVVDPPVVPRYAVGVAAVEQWVTFDTWRVHQRCLDARRDGQPITDGCATHLIGAASTTGGAT